MLNNNNNSNHNNMPGNYDNLSFMSLLASGTSNTSTTTNNNTNNNNNNNNTNNNSTNNLSGSPSQQQLSSSISSSATIPSNNSSNSLYQSVPYGPHPRIPTTSTTTTAATNNTNATTSIPTPHTPQQQQQQALLMMSSAGTSLDPSSLAAHHHHHPHAHAAHFNALSHTHPVHHHHHHPALHAHAAHTHHHATAAHHHHHHHPQFSHLQTGGHQPQPRFTSSAAAIMAARYQQYQHYHLYDHGSACSCCEPIIKPPNSHMTLMTQSSSGSNLASLTASNSPQQQQQQQQAAAAAQQPLKSPNSCRQCRASHRRCDRLLPSCTQCLKRKVAVTCVYEPLKTQQSSTASSKDKDSASVANNSNSNNNNSNNNTTTTTSTATATATTTANNGGTCCDDHETGGDEKSPSTGGLQHSSSSPSLSDGNNKKMQQQKKKRSDASSNNGNGGSSNGSSSSSNKRQKMQDDSTEEEQSTTNSSVSPSSPPSTNAALVDQQQQQQQQNMTALQRSASSSSLSGLSGSVNGGGATMPSTSPTRNNNNHFGSSSNLVSQAQQTTIFDGSQVEQYVMEHPSVATASLDVNNSGGSGGGNSGPLKLNALSSSSHQILDGCFQLVSPKEMGIHSDEFEHNLIAQFLYNKTIPNHLFHPQNENSLDQQAFLDQKASQALWFAFQAIALQQLPAMEKSPFVNTAQETRLCERVLEKLLYSMVNIKRNVSSLVQLMCKFPRTLLMQASRNMCRLAEQILLDPKIFPFIGKHMVLAQACCFLVFYLLVIGEQPEEAAVFLKAVKVYADREQRVLDIAPANVTNIISRQQLQTQQMVIQGLIDAYAAMKSALWFNSAAPKQNDFHTKKSLHKFIKLSLQAALVGSSYSSDSRLVLLKQHECLKRLKDILDNGDDTKDQLYRFLLTCQEMRRDVTNLPVESFMNTIWHIYVFNFEVFALEIAAAQLNCDFAQLQSIQVNLANEIAQEWLNCLPVVISSGARSMNLLKFISRVHIQHSVQLCSNMNVSFEDTEILMEALKFLQIDIIILDAIHNKYGVTKYKEMSDQVKIQEQIHKRFMAQTLGLQVDNVVPLPQSAASTPYNVPLPPSSSSSSALAPTTDNVEGPTSSSSSSSVGPTTTTTTTAAASSSNSIPMHENTGGLLPEQHRPMIGQPMNESLFMDLFNWQGY